MTSSKTVHWCTPEAVLSPIRTFAGARGIGLDPCSNPDSLVGAKVAWSDRPAGADEYYILRDGLAHPWKGHGLVYANWPYSRDDNPRWAEKAAAEGAELGAGDELITLCAARTSEVWFEAVWRARALCFWRRRLRFLGGQSGAPFSSVVGYWGARPERFERIFGLCGQVVFPSARMLPSTVDRSIEVPL